MTLAQQTTETVPATRPCPICDSAETNHFVEKNDYNFLKCKNCELVFIHPELPPVDLAPLYSEKGEPVDQETRYPYDKGAHRRKRATVRATRVSKYFKGKTAVDIGCGGGYMTDAMQRKGAVQAVGIDLDPEAIAFGKKNHHKDAQFYNESIQEFIKRGQTFDFGHSSQVIEHVGDFNDFVAGWAALIKPGGHFFLKTPDRNHWRVGEKPETWPNPPHYTQYFSRKNIRLLFEKHGFEIVKMYFNFKPAMEILVRRKSD